eukprot:UN01271
MPQTRFGCGQFKSLSYFLFVGSDFIFLLFFCFFPKKK